MRTSRLLSSGLRWMSRRHSTTCGRMLSMAASSCGAVSAACAEIVSAVSRQVAATRCMGGVSGGGERPSIADILPVTHAWTGTTMPKLPIRGVSRDRAPLACLCVLTGLSAMGVPSDARGAGRRPGHRALDGQDAETAAARPQMDGDHGQAARGHRRRDDVRARRQRGRCRLRDDRRHLDDVGRAELGRRNAGAHLRPAHAAR